MVASFLTPLNLFYHVCTEIFCDLLKSIFGIQGFEFDSKFRKNNKKCLGLYVCQPQRRDTRPSPYYTNEMCAATLEYCNPQTACLWLDKERNVPGRVALIIQQKRSVVLIN